MEHSQHVPLDVILSHIVPRITSKECLHNLALCNKGLYKNVIPGLKHYLKQRRRLGLILNNMIDMTERLERKQVMWKFSYKWMTPITNESLSFVLYKKGGYGNRLCQINGEYPHENFCKDRILDWFLQYIMFEIENVSFQSVCDRSSLKDRDVKKFNTLTYDMLMMLDTLGRGSR